MEQGVLRESKDSLIFYSLMVILLVPRTCFGRHGKSRKHASVACGQFFRKLWTFLDKQRIFGRNFLLLITNYFCNKDGDGSIVLTTPPSQVHWELEKIDVYLPGWKLMLPIGCGCPFVIILA